MLWLFLVNELQLVKKQSQFNSDASVIRKEQFDTARTCMDNFVTGILTKYNRDDVSTQHVTTTKTITITENI